MVVLHGFLEQGYAWDAVARALPNRVVAPDHRGHGLSDHVGAGGFYHFWDYVADVDALVRDLGTPVDLVGHSMGGTIACLFAGTRPESVRRLVLVEGLGPPDMSRGVVDRARRFLDGMADPPRHRGLDGPSDGARRIRRPHPGIDQALALNLAERTTRPVVGEDPHVSGPATHTWSWDPLHRARSPVPFQAEQFMEFLRRITAPTLCIDGATSSFRVDDEAERFQCLSSAGRAVVPGAGHMVHHDAPETLARLISEHLDG